MCRAMARNKGSLSFRLDFTGPHQFLSRMLGSRTTVASFIGGAVASEGRVFADTCRLNGVSGWDLLCVPGGLNALDVALDNAFIVEIRRLGGGVCYVTSVCTGSLILGAAGLLRGKRAACHWAWRYLLPLFGAIPDERRVVKDGCVFTGEDVTAGIDFALTVLAEIAGEKVAQTLQLGLEYAPAPPFSAGRPENAPSEILVNYRDQIASLLAQRETQAREAAARLSSIC